MNASQLLYNNGYIVGFFEQMHSINVVMKTAM